MFGKKRTQPARDSAQAEERVRTEKLAPYDIHVMPVKFASASAPKSRGKLWIAVIALILLIAGGAAAAYLAFIAPVQPPSPAPAPVTPEEIEEQQPAATTPSVPKTPEAPAVATPSQPSPTPSAEQQPPAAVTEPTSYTSTVDTDKDGLTDSEEDLYETERLRPDTDGDGYVDGVEVSGGYSPKAANTLIIDSGLVNTYTNPAYGYSVLYPSKWLARPADQSLTEVRFQSSTREFVSIQARQNAQRQPLAEWYTATQPSADVNALRQTTTRQGMQIITDTAGLRFFLMNPQNPDTIFELRYDVGDTLRLNFKTTVDMMVGSLRLQ